jgi:hypothetical protein
MTESYDPVDKAVELADSASKRDPRMAKYGIIIADQSTGLMTYAALWFGTLDRVAEYLTESFAVLDCKDADEDSFREIELVAQDVSNGVLNADVLDALNHFAVGWISLIWGGTFEELCRAERDVPRNVIALFRNTSDKDHVDPIQPSEMELFVEFLADLKNG